jgi:hypothetical protein
METAAIAESDMQTRACKQGVRWYCVGGLALAQVPDLLLEQQMGAAAIAESGMQTRACKQGVGWNGVGGLALAEVLRSVASTSNAAAAAGNEVGKSALLMTEVCAGMV